MRDYAKGEKSETSRRRQSRHFSRERREGGQRAEKAGDNKKSPLRRYARREQTRSHKYSHQKGSQPVRRERAGRQCRKQGV